MNIYNAMLIGFILGVVSAVCATMVVMWIINRSDSKHYYVNKRNGWK